MEEQATIHTLTRTANAYPFDGKPTPWKPTADAGCVIRWAKDRYNCQYVKYVAETETVWRVERYCESATYSPSTFPKE